jgi:hypothetical protein
MYLTIFLSIALFFIKKKKLILSNITVLLTLVILAEFIFYFLTGMPKKTTKEFNASVFPYDHKGYPFGYVPPWGDSVLHKVQINNSDTIFDVHYSIDHQYRRITPNHDTTKQKYAVFFGCSVTFGWGLEDDQTLPFFFQEESNLYNSYNYAYSGWGMHNMLARLEQKDLSSEVPEKDGIGVYVFLWSHIRRAIGDMRIYTGWGHQMPYYTIENNELVNKGNFANDRFFTSKFYEILYRSNIINYFKITLPLKIKKKHYVLASEIIKKAKQEYIQQFGNDNFYVIIFPIDWKEFTNERKEEFLSYLIERDIDYFDYSDSVQLINEYIIAGDGHPNALTHQKISKLLISDLHIDTDSVTNNK